MSELTLEEAREWLRQRGDPVDCNACGAPAVYFEICIDRYIEDGKARWRPFKPRCPRHQWCEQHQPADAPCKTQATA